MIDPVAFYLGSIAIRWYGIIISSALLIGTLLSIREAGRHGIDEEKILDLFIIMVPAAVIGARLYYVIFNINYYLANPGRILSFRSGGMAIHGAVLAGILTIIYFTGKHKISFWRLADIISPYLILGQAIGRWGNFINQEAH
ncbi:MAG: prolipoprotein diacylglyceryl transferase, partial [Halanaerobiaceae bacterium]